MDAIYFDLDGTLTDPKPGITGSIQYALQKLDRPVPTQDELTWCIGRRFAPALSSCSAARAGPTLR
jgi:phosphoglycolate phosphatase-like HAD superfamily hydrolase